MFPATKAKHDPVIGHVLACVAEVQKTLGMGLVPDAYREGLMMEMQQRAISFQVAPRVPAFYRGSACESMVLVPDLLVADRLPVNICANARELMRPERRRLRTVLTMSQYSLGFVLNFDEVELAKLVTAIDVEGRFVL